MPAGLRAGLAVCGTHVLCELVHQPLTRHVMLSLYIWSLQEVLQQESHDGGEAIRQRLQQHYKACIDDIQQQHAMAVEGLQQITSLVQSLQGLEGGAVVGEAAREGMQLGGEQQAELEGALVAMQTLEQEVAYVSGALTVATTRLAEVQAVVGLPDGLGERQPALLLADHGVSFLASLLTPGSAANLVVVQEAPVTAGETSSMLVSFLLNDSTLKSVREAHAAGEPITLSTDNTAVVYVAHSHGTGLALCGSHLEVLYPADGVDDLAPLEKGTLLLPEASPAFRGGQALATISGGLLAPGAAGNRAAGGDRDGGAGARGAAPAAAGAAPSSRASVAGRTFRWARWCCSSRPLRVRRTAWDAGQQPINGRRCPCAWR